MPGLRCRIEAFHLSPAFTVDANLAAGRDVYQPSAGWQRYLDVPISLFAHYITECDDHTADRHNFRACIEVTDGYPDAVEDAIIRCHLYDKRLLSGGDAKQLERRWRCVRGRTGRRCWPRGAGQTDKRDHVQNGFHASTSL